MDPHSFRLGFELGRDRALLRLLELLGEGRKYTAELLDALREWGRGHEALKEAVRLGLVKRYREGRRVYNELTAKGLEALRLAREATLGAEFP